MGDIVTNSKKISLVDSNLQIDDAFGGGQNNLFGSFNNRFSSEKRRRLGSQYSKRRDSDFTESDSPMDSMISGVFGQQ